jgi:hypothetical protein
VLDLGANEGGVVGAKALAKVRWLVVCSPFITLVVAGIEAQQGAGVIVFGQQQHRRSGREGIRCDDQAELALDYFVPSQESHHGQGGEVADEGNGGEQENHAFGL